MRKFKSLYNNYRKLKRKVTIISSRFIVEEQTIERERLKKLSFMKYSEGLNLEVIFVEFK